MLCVPRAEYNPQVGLEVCVKHRTSTVTFGLQRQTHGMIEEAIRRMHRQAGLSVSLNIAAH
jgi:hypothetical protein